VKALGNMEGSHHGANLEVLGTGTVDYDLSATVLMHLNRGLPESTVYGLSTVR
jgi:hypothetical protein